LRKRTDGAVLGSDEPGDGVADLVGGHRSLVVVRPQPDGVQPRGPAGALQVLADRTLLVGSSRLVREL
jgi:hypothetical protein